MKINSSYKMNNLLYQKKPFSFYIKKSFGGFLILLFAVITLFLITSKPQIDHLDKMDIYNLNSYIEKQFPEIYDYAYLRTTGKQNINKTEFIIKNVSGISRVYVSWVREDEEVLIINSGIMDDY